MPRKNGQSPVLFFKGKGAKRSKKNGHKGEEEESDSDDELLFMLSKDTKSFIRGLQNFLCNN